MREFEMFKQNLYKLKGQIIKYRFLKVRFKDFWIIGLYIMQLPLNVYFSICFVFEKDDKYAFKARNLCCV